MSLGLFQDFHCAGVIEDKKIFHFNAHRKGFDLKVVSLSHYSVRYPIKVGSIDSKQLNCCDRIPGCKSCARLTVEGVVVQLNFIIHLF